MADYPAALWVPSSAVLDAIIGPSEWQAVIAEIVAAQTELGVNPRGSDATVAARLARLDAIVGGFGKMGAQGLVCEPGTTTATQVRVRFDRLAVEGYVVENFDKTATISTAGKGGLANGTEAADTHYAVWVVYNPTSGDADLVFSTAFVRSSLDLSHSSLSAAGYTKAARVHSVRNDSGSNFVRAVRQGDDVALDVAGGADATANPAGARVLSGASATSKTSVALDKLVPPTSRLVRLLANLHCTQSPAADVTVNLFSGDSTLTTTGRQILVTGQQYTAGNWLAAMNLRTEVWISCSATQTVGYRLSSAPTGTTLGLEVWGYRDPVGA